MFDMFIDAYFFFFKQKTAYEMRISDWSSDVCSSDLLSRRPRSARVGAVIGSLPRLPHSSLSPRHLLPGPIARAVPLATGNDTTVGEQRPVATPMGPGDKPRDDSSV